MKENMKRTFFRRWGQGTSFSSTLSDSILRQTGQAVPLRSESLRGQVMTCIGVLEDAASLAKVCRTTDGSFVPDRR